MSRSLHRGIIVLDGLQSRFRSARQARNVMQWRQARNVLLLLFLAALALTISSSDVPNRSQVAAMVARKWADASISQVAEALGDAATLNVSVLRSVAARVIKDKIRDKINWTFSTPQRVEGSPRQYDVTATALAPLSVDVLLLHLRFTISGDFRLRIDTRTAAVSESHFDPLSFRIKQVEP